MKSVLTTRAWVLLIAASLLVAAGTLNFAQRLTRTPPPTDGVAWEQTDKGIYARAVAPNSAASRAGILGIVAGDRLIAMSNDEEHNDPIVATEDIPKYLEDAAHTGQRLGYIIQRPTAEGGTREYYVYLDNLQPIPNRTTRDYYINFIGIVYLLVGLFILFKQGGRAPFVLHFTTLCLAAFVLHFYKPVGFYEDLDLAVSFLDDAAYVLFAPLFLHFCAVYPVRRRLSEGKRWLAPLLYAPAVALVLLTTLVDFTPSSRLNFSDAFIGNLYKAEFAHFWLALVGGATLLVRRFWKSKVAVVRQQLKWVVWGSVLAVTPFTLLYAVGYLFGDMPAAAATTGAGAERWLLDAAVLPLILIPLTFGNSVVRYRLMDVDVVVRRAAVYALTTLAIALMIGVVVYVAGLYAFGGEVMTPGVITLRVIIAVLAMTVIVMMAAPIKNFLQEQTDRLFYGERYDLRNGLLDFGRTLSATTTLEPLLDALVGRLEQVLGVARVAIFIEDARAASGYRVARSVGLSAEVLVPQDFREMIRVRSAEAGIVRADDIDLQPETSGFVRRALHYYVPCVVRGRMVAVIGLGRASDGSLLSSEDLDILQTISGYVAVAIENSLLYQEQEKRAAELALLKEFNESIVESVNVGLLAVDENGRVTRSNSMFEEMLGLRREETVGKLVEELFDENFAHNLTQILGKSRWHLQELRNAYKLHTTSADGKPLILNVAVAPLRSVSNEQTGSIVVLENVTSRVKLEETLQQSEKLSSIGLLAAGVAHEVNTPLTGVSSYTQMLLGMIPETDPKHALLLKVQKQTERATNIAGNLLNFSRAGNGAGTEFGEIDVNKILDDTLQLLEPQLRKSRVEVLKNYLEKPPKIYGNAGKLQQVFTNLVLNARDAMFDGGTITLTTSAAGDEAVVIEVADTGIGIDPENMSKIYDPFFTTKGVGSGTGLGLAVSYGIVQEHAGTIEVESEVGGGTTFRLEFPVAEKRQQQQRAVS